MTRGIRLARVEDAACALRIQYGRSGAWARIAQKDGQQLLDAIEAAAAEAAEKDGGPA